MFILGEMVFQMILAALQQKNGSVFLMKLLKLIYTWLVYTAIIVIVR